MKTGPRETFRIDDLDATRGLAMLGVLVSHCSLYVRGGWPDFALLMTTVGMVATPTFLLLSGLLMGRRWQASPLRRLDDRWRVMDRALFLLVVVHIVLGVSESTWRPLHEALLSNFYITDAIGASVLLATVFFREFSARLLVIAGVVLAVSTSLLLLVPVQGGTGLTLTEWLLFGIEPHEVQMDGYVVPLVPYLGVFLIGAAMGRRYACTERMADGRRRNGNFMLRVGAIGMALAIALKLSWLLLFKGHVPEVLHWPLYRLLEPTQKIPPSLTYLLAFGGSGTFLCGVLHRLPESARATAAFAATAVIGRASIAVFIAQCWLIYYPAKVMGFNAIGWMILPVFAATVASLWYLAKVWDERGYNRYLKFGLVGARRAEEGVDAMANAAR